MCGIVGYIGQRNATPLIIDGLRRLEYRGYDSAGIAVVENGAIALRREVGKLSNLCDVLETDPISGQVGIGHTRWATHGSPARHNAHPHVSMNGDFVVVHNGIVENYLQLRQQLTAQGVVFTSDTDSEVIVQLIGCNAHLDVTEATRDAVRQIKGAHAIVVLSRRQPDRLVAVRIGNAGGITVGLGAGENFIASDVPALLSQTRRLIFLENRQLATVSVDQVLLQTLDGAALQPEIHEIPHDEAWDTPAATKGEYAHFMQKEIFEQGRSLTDTIRGRVDFEREEILLPELNLTAEAARSLNRLVIVACGSSYYSALVGKFYIEQFARLNVEVDYGSEYRYRDPILDKHTAVLAITQSGETVDTLAALEEAREKGAAQAPLWSIVNAIGSQAMRLADGCITMNAGPEIGVASTKAFTASIAAQYLLALYLGQLRGTLSDAQRHACIQAITRLPNLVGQVLDQSAAVEQLAQEVAHYANFLYLGRGIHYPIALEGALKLKEISYIHAEGYPAGEMKHGPIALIDANMPVLAIALQDALYDKMISQIEQAKSRGGIVIAIASEGDRLIASKADKVLYIPNAPEHLHPILSVIPLQLLAYYVALQRGADVDQPRNLAKSVTVE